jgi:pimeloyl-ACP methyl ester carboxylesterase
MAGARVRMSKVLAVAAVAAALALAACSSDGDDGDDGDAAAGGVTSTTTAATGSEATGTTAAPADVEPFTGTLDEFYVAPDPLPPGEPGDVVRVMPIDAPAGQEGLRVMYRSTDAEGDARAATGTIHFPSGEAPEGGWPVLAWAHGTTGLASRCAPSRAAGVPPAFGVEGVLVAPDYIGLGPVGEVHPYLSAAAEANAMVDGVAAARSLADVGAGDEWVVVGVSQGGHAALVTGEAAADRLPDAELLGTVAVAPGAELGSTFGDDLQARVITTMVLVGVAAEDPTVDLADYLSAPVQEASAVIREGCVADIVATMGSLAATPGYFTTDPRTSPLGQAWVAENDPGQVVSDAPVLVVQGGRDALVLPARTAALLARMCGNGQVVEAIDVPEGDHDTVTGLAADDIAAWVADRFAGEPPVDDC